MSEKKIKVEAIDLSDFDDLAEYVVYGILDKLDERYQLSIKKGDGMTACDARFLITYVTSYITTKISGTILRHIQKTEARILKEKLDLRNEFDKR